jgi:hypothetical protein
MTEAFIDGNIWKINLHSKNGVFYNCFPLRDIFYYNSLKDKTFDKCSEIPQIQIPEKLISGLGLINYYVDKSSIFYGYKSVKKFILDNKNIIIKNQYPIMKREINEEEEKWSVDLNMLFYDKNKNWKK